MSVRVRWVSVVIVIAAVSTTASAQTPAAQAQHEHQPPSQALPQAASHQPDSSKSDPAQTHDHETGMAFRPREASATAWLPDATPMYGLFRQAGAWQLMAHGNAFVQFLHDSGDRGHDQLGSINWVMGMARRDLRRGRLGLRGMISLEPLTVAGCGYPDLLASGETCDGDAIHDRQHPHDLLMEIAAEYERPLHDSVRWQVYGGLAGEPALGPVAYPHRPSAMTNPLAPIAHHWLDATHITFGVVTAGVFNSRWKAEASIFNGREPDQHRADFDFGALDSVSGRVSFLPSSSVALQVSAGHLEEAEAGHDGAPRTDVNRLTASVTYHRRRGPANNIWATTAAWGRNSEAGESTHVLLVETNVTRRERDNWFGRFEIGGKQAHDLDVHDSDETFTVAKLQAGFTRYLTAWRGLTPGYGGSLSAGVVPRSLESVYGSRVNLGFGLFLTLRPVAHRM